VEWVETRESQILRALIGVVPISLIIRDRVAPTVEAKVWVWVCDRVNEQLSSLTGSRSLTAGINGALNAN